MAYNTKATVGLANVDNTSDINKPVSTATQTVLNAKAATTDPRFTDARDTTSLRITDASTVGKSLITAATAQAARDLLGITSGGTATTITYRDTVYYQPSVPSQANVVPLTGPFSITAVTIRQADNAGSLTYELQKIVSNAWQAGTVRTTWQAFNRDAFALVTADYTTGVRALVKVIPVDTAKAAEALLFTQDVAANTPDPTPSGDTIAPSAPTGLSVAPHATTAQRYVLTWQASTDNVGVVKYQISLNTTASVYADNITTLSASYFGLNYSTPYDFRVRAVDAAGNVSAWALINYTTPAAPVTP